MAEIPKVLPSARLFFGPGDKLFGFDTVWVLLSQGRRAVIGNQGDDKRDIALLTHILGRTDKASTYNELSEILRAGTEAERRKHDTYERQCPKALRGDTPLVWTVDFDQGYLFYDRDGVHRFHQFKMPQKRPISMRHLQPYFPRKPPCRPSKLAARICSTNSAPPDVIPQQLFDLVYRLASDYERNWRETGLTIERDGLHQLAMGLLSCFTLTFRVQKIDARAVHLAPYIEQPDPSSLLRWRAWPSPLVVSTVSLGNTQIIFTEDMCQAMTLVQEHFASVIMCPDDRAYFAYSCNSKRKTHQFDVTVHYIVTSIREIQYFKKSQYDISATPAIPFFNGQDLPFKTGVRWMLNAIHGEHYPIRSSLYNLPLELQEMILDYASEDETSLIGRAVYASLLGIGVPFRWTENRVPLRSCELSKRRKLSSESAEHQVSIWGTYVGLSYQKEASDTREYGWKFLSESAWQFVETKRAKAKYYEGWVGVENLQ